MNNFTYIRPESLEEAGQVLSENASDAIPFSGGTDALGLMKNKVIAPETVVNLKSIPGMRDIEYSGRRGLMLGALVTIADISKSQDIKDNYPILSEAATEIASPQLRNAGTLGGNLCQRPRCWYFRGEFDCLKKGGDQCYALDGENQRHCIIGGGPCFIVHPSDMAVALLALEAEISVFSNGQTRTIPIQDLYHVPGEDPTSEITLGPGEIVTSIHVPSPPNNTVSRYVKIKDRNVWDFAMVSVGVALRMRGNTIRSGRIAFGGVAPIPWTDEDLNGRLSGLDVSGDEINDITSSLFSDATVLSKNGYKVPLVRNVTRRLLQQINA